MEQITNKARNLQMNLLMGKLYRYSRNHRSAVSCYKECLRFVSGIDLCHFHSVDNFNSTFINYRLSLMFVQLHKYLCAIFGALSGIALVSSKLLQL